jgi:hypothetical protein
MSGLQLDWYQRTSYLKEKNVGTSYLAAKAIEDLFAKTGTKPEEMIW